uniref:Uncharacterized protein n=1 Tax=viral metagenome TaxID=1070528 RepID=A0A6M3KQ56_9ZZZZ
MNDPNRGVSQELLTLYKRESYERFRLQLFEAIEILLTDFEMTWDDLADKLQQLTCVGTSGITLKQKIGWSESLTDEFLNDVAAVFSMELHLIFRPRLPGTLL